MIFIKHSFFRANDVCGAKMGTRIILDWKVMTCEQSPTLDDQF